MQHLFSDIRLPKIVVAEAGSLLAFANRGRLMRRSENRGETWLEARELGSESRGNVVVDRNFSEFVVAWSRKRQ